MSLRFYVVLLYQVCHEVMLLDLVSTVVIRYLLFAQDAQYGKSETHVLRSLKGAVLLGLNMTMARYFAPQVNYTST